VLAFLTVTLIPLGALAFLGNRNISTALSANVGGNLKNVAQSQSLAIGNQLAQQIATVKLLSVNQNIALYLRLRNRLYPSEPAAIREQIKEVEVEWQAANAANDDNAPQVQAHTNSPVAADLRQYRIAFPNNAEVIVTDKYGALYATAARTLNYYYAEDEWWQATRNNGQGAVYVSQPALDPSSKTYAIYISAPVFDPDTREWIGAVRATFRVDGLKGILASAQLGKTGQVWLALPDGQLLTKAGLQALSDAQWLPQLQASARDYVELNVGSVPQLMSLAPVASVSSDPEVAAIISNSNWRVIASQQRSEGLAPVQAGTQGLLALALVLAVVVAGAGFGMAQLLANPIVQLTGVAQQVSQGNLTARADIRTHDEIGTLARAFDGMTAQVRNLIGSLEQRVEERTRQLAQRARYLEATAAVAREAASVLQVQELQARTVNLISEQFGFYHAGIFLIDPTREWAELQAASSEGGQRLLARQHRLRAGQGIVGTVAQQGTYRLALDTGADAQYFNNPDLPDTRSEIALPLRVRGETIGVLDVQSREPNAFSQEDLTTLQSLADQIAAAINTARLFAQQEANAAAERRAYGQLSAEAWQALLRGQQQLGVLSRAESTRLTDEPLRPEMEQALHLGQTTLDAASQTQVAVPIKVRDQIVGVMSGRKPGGAGQWTQEEIALLQTWTEQLATALESARLYQDTQRRAAREQLTGAITAKMRESLDMQRVLQTAADEMFQAFGLEEVAIHLAADDMDGKSVAASGSSTV
jgi:GAF domain-containing protein/HAMP domain-containing protein